MPFKIPPLIAQNDEIPEITNTPKQRYSQDYEPLWYIGNLTVRTIATPYKNEICGLFINELVLIPANREVALCFKIKAQMSILNI